MIAGERAVGGYATRQATQCHWLVPASNVYWHTAVFEDIDTLSKQSRDVFDTSIRKNAVHKNNWSRLTLILIARHNLARS